MHETLPNLLLLIEHVEGLLLEESQVRGDLRLHRIGLGTELFRVAFHRFRFLARRVRDPAGLVRRCALAVQLLAKFFEAPGAVPKLGVPSGDFALSRDRKSTRLNSSHLVISYAVFCLKKKKNIYHVVSFS